MCFNGEQFILIFRRIEMIRKWSKILNHHFKFWITPPRSNWHLPLQYQNPQNISLHVQICEIMLSICISNLKFLWKTITHEASYLSWINGYWKSIIHGVDKEIVICIFSIVWYYEIFVAGGDLPWHIGDKRTLFLENAKLMLHQD